MHFKNRIVVSMHVTTCSAKAKSTRRLDVTFYIHTGVDPDMVLREGYTLPLHKLRSFLGGLRSVQLQPPQKMSLSLKYKTFDQQDRELSIDVDVLVSPNWENPADLYNYLTTAKHNGATSTQLFW